jgi:hypothetical protein
MACCLLVISSCERAANVEVPSTEPQPVMYSFLSPDSKGSAVTLTMSVPIFGNNSSGEFKPITVATVTIKDNNGNSMLMPFDVNNGAYYLAQTEFAIVPGHTYTVEAKFNNYTLTASTTVPLTIIPFEEVVAEKLSTDPNGVDRYFLKMKWKDQSNVSNYYRINLEELSSVNPKDTFSFSIGDKMYTDVGKDGEVLSDKYEYFNYEMGSDIPEFYAYLLNSDIHYYEYHKRRLNYFGDDPFSEPVQQYSNVKGGLGVVCSYRKSSMKVVL